MNDVKKGAVELRFIDLFCGIGGFRLAFEAAAKDCGVKSKCVFSSDIDDACARAYAANFSDVPMGDITQIASSDIPDHDVLLAGFPCQPFSIIGGLQRFLDPTGQRSRRQMANGTSNIIRAIRFRQSRA